MSHENKPALRNVLIDAMSWGAKFKWQYVDYGENTWTIPVQITMERINSVIRDFSVRKIAIEIDVSE